MVRHRALCLSPSKAPESRASSGGGGGAGMTFQDLVPGASFLKNRISRATGLPSLQSPFAKEELTLRQMHHLAAPHMETAHFSPGPKFTSHEV